MRQFARFVFLLAFMPLSAAFASDLSDSRQLICAPVEAIDCVSGDACLKGLPADFGVPAFMRIDMAKKTITGTLRTTPIQLIEKTENQILMQGTELNFGWTLVIDPVDGAMVATLIDRNGAYVLFGSCTTL